MTKINTLIIWDSTSKPQSFQNPLMLWNSYEHETSREIFSICEIVENNAKKLRTKYLKFVYDLGELEVNNQQIIKHLELKPNFSYWWMTLINEKCNFSKSPEINDSIKILALESWLKENSFESIHISSSNKSLVDSLKMLCKHLSINFSEEILIKNDLEINFYKKIFHSLPYILRSLVWFIYHLIKMWPLKGAGISKWSKTKAKITFVSYLFNLDFEHKKNGVFKSHYWTVLPEKLKENNLKSNWLHIFVENEVIPNAVEAKNTIIDFNKTYSGEQTHATLHSFLSFKVIISVLMDWFFIIRIQTRLKKIVKKKSNFLWPFLKNDFLSSFIGPTSINNLLVFNLFQAAMGKIPKQDTGFYLQENQSWEYGLIHSWLNSGHQNNLVGVPHTPSKFWDLRFYFDKRCYLKKHCSLPTPTFVGVNGENAKKMILDNGFPRERLIELEALRYLHLNKKNSVFKPIANIVSILVLGDYEREKTIKLMQTLQEAIRNVSTEIKLIVKAHPACKIISSDYPELDLSIRNEPINELLDNISVVYVSCNTSASIDAYLHGKIVLTLLEPKSLNLSPLKGAYGAIFVKSASHLTNILKEFESLSHPPVNNKDYFYLNLNLPRWSDLLLNPDKIISK